MRNTILPTFHCFDDALELIAARVAEGADGVLLVHGIAVGANGEPYAHAWVEEHGLSWDSGLWQGQRIYYAVGVAEFYAARQIVQTTKYTAREAAEQNHRTHSYGPWEPVYRALCREAGRGRIVGQYDATYAPDVPD
jgi:hypothetical protein